MHIGLLVGTCLALSGDNSAKHQIGSNTSCKLMPSNASQLTGKSLLMIGLAARGMGGTTGPCNLEGRLLAMQTSSVEESESDSVPRRTYWL